MSTEKKKTQGFASMDPERHKSTSSKGGQAKRATKGFGSISKEELSKRTAEWAKARWEKVRAERQLENGK